MALIMLLVTFMIIFSTVCLFFFVQLDHFFGLFWAIFCTIWPENFYSLVNSRKEFSCWFRARFIVCLKHHVLVYSDLTIITNDQAISVTRIRYRVRLAYSLFTAYCLLIFQIRGYQNSTFFIGLIIMIRMKSLHSYISFALVNICHSQPFSLRMGFWTPWIANAQLKI